MTEWKGIATSCHYILHCAQPFVKFGYFCHANRLLEHYRTERLSMDKVILDCALESKSLQKFVYVAGTLQPQFDRDKW